MATAVVGMVCTADDADAKAFPLNKAVLLTDVLAASGIARRSPMPSRIGRTSALAN